MIVSERKLINASVLTSEDKMAYSTSQGELVFCNTRKLETIKTLKINGEGGVWVSGSCGELVIVQTPNKIVTVSSRDYKPILEIPCRSKIVQLAIDPDAKFISAFCEDGSVALHSLRDGSSINYSVPKVEYAQSCIGFEIHSRNRMHLFHLASTRRKEDNRIRVFDSLGNKEVYSSNTLRDELGQEVVSAVFSLKKEPEVLLATQSKGIFCLDPAAAKTKLLFMPEAKIYRIVSVKIQNRNILCLFAEDGRLLLYELSKFTRLDTFRLPAGFVRNASVDPSGCRLSLVVQNAELTTLAIFDLRPYWFH